MGIIGTLIMITTLAGVVGTGFGGALGTLFRKDSKKNMSLLLSFAGGVMLSVVCFDLLRDAIETEVGIVVIAGTLLAGVAVVYLLNYIIDRKAKTEVLSENKNGKLSLFIAGIVMASAVALHNVPVGMTIGASYASDNGVLGSSALMLAGLISLHNIPEGMSIAAPLISGGMSRIKAVLVTAASGAPTIAGALLGYELGDIGAMGLALSLSFASGAMLYVVFGEILPQAVQMNRGKLPTFFTIMGMMVGLLVIYL